MVRHYALLYVNMLKNLLERHVALAKPYNNKPLVCIFETQLLSHLWTDLSKIADRDQGMSRSWHIQILDKLVTVAMVMQKPSKSMDIGPISMIFAST